MSQRQRQGLYATFYDEGDLMAAKKTTTKKKSPAKKGMPAGKKCPDCGKVGSACKC